MGQFVVFLPGLLCDGRLWRDQIAALGAERCLVADLTRDDSVEAMAARALAAATARGAARIAVAGLSMGGYVAFAMLRAAPGRISRLALFATSARADTPEQIRRRKLLLALGAKGSFRGVTPRLLPRLIAPTRLGDAALAGAVMDMAERVGREAFIRQQRAIIARPDSRTMLPAIAVPTLVAVGAEDGLTPPEHAREIAAGIPGARLATIEGAGHLTPMERPDEVSRLLLGWMEGKPGEKPVF